MTTAVTAMLDLARLMGDLIEDTATSGSNTTIVGTNLSGFPEASVDNAFTRGTAFVVTTTDGLAPQSEVVAITGYASTGYGTVTVGGFSGATVVGAGDTFGVTKIPRGELYAALNSALRDMGGVPAEDVSLTTAAATRSHTIPAAAKADLRQVWIAQRTSEPYDWEEQHHWGQRRVSTYDLVWPFQPISGYKIKLVYVAPHATLTTPTAVLDDVVPYDYLQWRAAYHHYRLRLHYPGKDEKRWTGLMNEAAEYAAQALRKHPVRLPQSTTRLWFTEEQDTGVGASISTADVATA